MKLCKDCLNEVDETMFYCKVCKEEKHSHKVMDIFLRPVTKDFIKGDIK